MKHPMPKADPTTALQALHRGQSAYPGYAVCKRLPWAVRVGTALQVITERLTYRQAVDACDTMPDDHLVCLMADYR